MNFSGHVDGVNLWLLRGVMMYWSTGPGRWLCGTPLFSITWLCLWTNVDLCCIFVHLVLCTGAPQCGDGGGWDWFEGIINFLINRSRLDGLDAASISVRLPAMLMVRIWTSLTFLWDTLICYLLSESWRNMAVQTRYSGALTCKSMPGKARVINVNQKVHSCLTHFKDSQAKFTDYSSV